MAATTAAVGAGESDLALRLAAGSFRDGTRVAGSSPTLVRAMLEAMRAEGGLPEGAKGEAVVSRWRATQDVWHPEFGHGWVQGTGGGIVTVRFETRTTGPGRIHTFDVDDEELQPADPLGSLDWEDTEGDEATVDLPQSQEQSDDLHE